MEVLTEYKELFKNRENMYCLLASIFKSEVTQELYSALADTDFDNAAETPLEEGYALIRHFMNEKREDALTDLAVDYARVFLGAGVVEKDKSAAPYESVYTSAERLIMQDARDKVVAAYRHNGLGVSDNFNVPEDHISLEFEFMAYLCRCAIDAYEKGDKKAFSEFLKEQDSFLNKHLLNWVPRFCGEVAEFSSTSFYKGAAALTKDYLDMEQYIIKEIIAEAE